MPKKHIMLVLSNAAEGRDAEFNEWYSNVHLHDGLKVPGFVGAQRFRLSEVQRKGAPDANWQYLTIWEMETDDPAEALAETSRRLRTPAMPYREDTITDIWAYVYEPMGERLKAVP